MSAPRWGCCRGEQQVRWISLAVEREGGLQSPFPDVDIPDVNLAQFILQGAERYGDRVAFKSATDPNDTLTFAQTANLARSIGKRFLEEGLKKGETVMTYLPNCHLYVPTILGIILAGGVCSLTNPGYGQSELRHQLETSRSKWLVTTSTQLEALRGRDGQDYAPPGVERVWTIDNGDPMWARREGEGEGAWPAVDPSDVCLLPFSSGTSGLPKGVMLTHRSIVANCIQTQSVEGFISEDVFISVLPTFHIFGFMMTMLGFSHGAEQRTMAKFDMAVYLEMMATGANSLHIVPPIAVGLSKYVAKASAQAQSFREWGVKSIMVGAAPLSANTENVLKEAFGCVVKQGYGMTELSPVSHFTHSDHIKQGSIGFLVPNTEARLMHPTTREPVPPGEEGEIWVRGPQVMKGYVVAPSVKEDPNATAFQDGWFKTGDVGRFDSEGYWFITDRVKELIKYKGFQVAPAELESELLTHDSITDALVFAVPGPDGEEHARALVVKRPGSDLQEVGVEEYIAGRLAHHKHLRGGVIFVDSVPKSASGKLLRREARAKYSG